MADFLDLNVTAGSNISVNVQRFTIEVRVVDSSDQSVVIADFTGANAIIWPNVLGTLTAAQRRVLLRQLLQRIIMVKAGLDDGLTE